MQNKTTEVGSLIDQLQDKKYSQSPNEVEASRVVSLAQVVQDVATLVLIVI